MKHTTIFLLTLLTGMAISACTADGILIIATPDPDRRASTTTTPQLIQLTDNRCCVQPAFAPDSETVLFIDKPDDAPAAIYGIDISDPGQPGDIELVYDIIGFRSPDHTLVAFPDPDANRRLRFIDSATEQQWTVNTLGNHPVFSSSGQRIFWNATDRRGPYDQQRTDIWIADTDGANVRQVITIYGGQAEAWLPSETHILITGRGERIGEKETLFVLSLEDGSMVDLAQENRLHGASISPDGTWVAYYTTFANNPEDNGVWGVRIDGSERRKLDFFGPYQWRDDTHLVYIPVRTSSDERMVVMEVDVESGKNRLLTGREAFSFTISDGDWTLSPDGDKLVFVSAEDKNLWLMTLP